MVLETQMKLCAAEPHFLKKIILTPNIRNMAQNWAKNSVGIEFI